MVGLGGAGVGRVAGGGAAIGRRGGLGLGRLGLSRFWDGLAGDDLVARGRGGHVAARLVHLHVVGELVVAVAGHGPAVGALDDVGRGGVRAVLLGLLDGRGVGLVGDGDLHLPVGVGHDVGDVGHGRLGGRVGRLLPALAL